MNLAALLADVSPEASFAESPPLEVVVRVPPECWRDDLPRVLSIRGAVEEAAWFREVVSDTGVVDLLWPDWPERPGWHSDDEGTSPALLHGAKVRLRGRMATMFVGTCEYGDEWESYFEVLSEEVVSDGCPGCHRLHGRVECPETGGEG